MSNQFTVVDCRNTIIDPVPRLVQAATPERAAEAILGVPVQRAAGRAKRGAVARVYWQVEGQSVSMVRLYARAAESSVEG